MALKIGMKKSLDILLLGDTSNFHNTLAKGLRKLGHRVTVASDGTAWMDTDRDIDLSRRDGKIGGLILWFKMRFVLRKRWCGYDVVSISGTHFARLHPRWLKSIFDYVRRHNRVIFQTALATDTFFISECLDPDSVLKYNEWRVGNKTTSHYDKEISIARNWLAPVLSGYCNHLSKSLDGVVTALYEYHVSVGRAFPHDRIFYGGIPVDIENIEYKPVTEIPGKVRLFMGFPSHRALEKGADRLLMAVRRVVEEFPSRCELDVVSDIKLSDFMEHLRNSHVVIDQLYSYTPATTALMAMAMGKTVMSGAEPEYYKFIGERELFPVINLDPRDDEAIYNAIKNVVLHPEDLRERGEQGRAFVERHNAADIVAQRFLDAWCHMGVK